MGEPGAEWQVLDEVDLFEDRLAHRRGVVRPDGLSLTEWRIERVRLIEACDQDLADDLAVGVTEELFAFAAAGQPLT